jgi:hypothetical protein
VQFADQRAEQAGVASPDRLGNGLDELRADRSFPIAQPMWRSIGGRGDVLVFSHAGLTERDCAESLVCTPEK